MGDSGNAACSFFGVYFQIWRSGIGCGRRLSWAPCGCWFPRVWPAVERACGSRCLLVVPVSSFFLVFFFVLVLFCSFVFVCLFFNCFVFLCCCFLWFIYFLFIYLLIYFFFLGGAGMCLVLGSRPVCACWFFFFVCLFVCFCFACDESGVVWSCADFAFSVARPFCPSLLHSWGSVSSVVAKACKPRACVCKRTGSPNQLRLILTLNIRLCVALTQSYLRVSISPNWYGLPVLEHT